MTSVLSDKNRYKCRVSSVLNKNIKEYGKENMFDGSDESCWNSHQGTPQHIAIQFTDENGQEQAIPSLTKLSIQFQGGFAGKDCEFWAITNNNNNNDASNSLTLMTKFFPDDINTVQTFDIPNCVNVKQVKIIFKESTDFFGRITIYKLDLLS